MRKVKRKTNPKRADPADDCDEQIKTSEESEKSMKNENGKHTKSVESEFPEEYSSAASLMPKHLFY